jgi:competence protein ComFC
VLTWLLDTLYPKRCVGCQREGSWLCQECAQAIVCTLSYPDELTCTLATYDERIVRDALHSLKYEGTGDIARPLIYTLWPQISEALQDFCEGASCLLPVPVHAKTFRDRGYSQAERLAQVLGGLLALPVRTDVLQKVQSGTQVGKTRKDRLVRQPFALLNPHESCAGVILVDDVISTGSTIAACRALLGEQTRAIVIARNDS